MLAPALVAVGKAGFCLDDAIPAGYLMRIGIVRVIALFRRLLRGRSSSNRVFGLQLGRNVIPRCKSKLSLGNEVRLEDGMLTDALSTHVVTPGDGSLFRCNCRVECTGSLSVIGKGLTIERNMTFGSDCYFDATGGIEIGDDVLAGQHIRFHSENHNLSDTCRLIPEQGVNHAGITIGDDCWIAAGAVFRRVNCWFGLRSGRQCCGDGWCLPTLLHYRWGPGESRRQERLRHEL